MLKSYAILWVPLLIGLISQIIKVCLDARKSGFSSGQIWKFGGMPSSHTALVVSLCTMIGWHEGAASPLFAVSIVLTIIVVWDAMGFRRFLGKQGRGLNKMVQLLNHKERKLFFPFEERIGHKPSEVIVGAIYGMTVTLLLNYLIFYL